jgi:endonuclease/exonuclease/phosphatase family metal-dependent hydrolase
MKSVPTRGLPGCIALLAAFAMTVAASAQTRTLRIVTYNIEDDTSGFTAPRPGLIIPSAGGTVQQGGVLEGIGEEILGNDPAQPIDILALQETTSNTATVTPIVNGLNSYYNAPGKYAMSTTQATSSGGVSSGGGPNALVYNTTTVQLLASVKVDPPAGQTLGSSSGEYREVMRYEFAPAGVTPTPANEFYIYVSHYKASTGSANEAARAGEATIIRNDEANNLPANAQVLYVGDYNVTGGSSEAGYQIMLAPMAPNGIQQGQAFDLLNPSGVTGIDWSVNSLQSLKTESAMSLRYRDDLELMTSNVLYSVPGGLALVPGTYHAFGNNGTTPYSASVNSGSNTSLTNLMAGAPISASTLLQDLTNASDHLPVVADFTIPVPPVLTPFQAWQIQYFGSTNNPAAAPNSDADGTGQNNQFKYVAGLDPTNPASIFVFKIATVTNQPVRRNLIFSPVAAGRSYTPQFRTDLVNGVWMPLTSYATPFVTNDSQVTITDTNAVLSPEFYRLNISLP